jgi:hypothetical protein
MNGKLVSFDKKHPEFADLQRVWQCTVVSHNHFAIAAWKAGPVCDGKQDIIATDGHRLAIYTRGDGSDLLSCMPIIEPGYYKAVKVRKTEALFEYTPELEDGMRYPNTKDVIPDLIKSTAILCPPAGAFTRDTESEYGYSCMLFDLWTRGCPMFNIELAAPLRGIQRDAITCRHTAANKPIRFDCALRHGTLLYVLMPINFKD